MADRATPAAHRAVISDEAVAQRLVRIRLEPRVEAGAHCQAALVDHLFAKTGDQLAAYLLGEIGADDHLSFGAAVHRHWLGLCRGGLRRGHVAVLDHAVDYPVAPAPRR